MSDLINRQDAISREFVKIEISYPKFTSKEHKGKPYYAIKYIENGTNCVIGFGTYSIEMLSCYIKKYFIMPSAQPEITDKQAIEHLQESGWMQNHDKQMYEMGLREQLADDSDSYNALLPSAQPYTADIKKIQDLEQAEIEKAFELGREDALSEIVRCKNCKWKQGAECVMFADVRPFPDDFCSRAERRTDE